MAEWLFGEIEGRFQEERGASRLGRRLREWRSEHPSFAGFEDVDALVTYFRDQSKSYELKDEIAGILCALFPGDELAKLLLLKLYAPGLIAKSHALLGQGLPQEELDFMLVDGFIRGAGKIRPGTKWVSARLLSAAGDRAWREIEKIQRRAERLKPEVP